MSMFPRRTCIEQNGKIVGPIDLMESSFSEFMIRYKNSGDYTDSVLNAKGLKINNTLNNTTFNGVLVTNPCENKMLFNMNIGEDVPRVYSVNEKNANFKGWLPLNGQLDRKNGIPNDFFPVLSEGINDLLYRFDSRFPTPESIDMKINREFANRYDSMPALTKFLRI